MNKTNLYLFIITFLLSACSSTRYDAKHIENIKINYAKQEKYLKQINNWQAEGKAFIKQNDSGISINFSWQEQDEVKELIISNNLGQGKSSLKIYPNLAILTTSNGTIIKAENASKLLKEHFNFSLPISYMSYWLRTIPSPNAYAQINYKENNLPNQIKQEGWQVSYLQYQKIDNQYLPKLIVAEKDSLKSKILIKNWKINP